MSTSYDERIFDAARHHVAGCLDGTLRLEYFNVVKEFLRRTNAWREEVSLPVEPTFCDYALPVMTGASITRLIWIEGPRPSSSTPGIFGRGTPRAGFLIHPYDQGTLLHVENPPAGDESWTAHLALTVGDPVSNDGLPRAPRWIVEKYHDYLLAGLLSKVMLHPNKPYSNEKMASFHGRKYEGGMMVATKEASEGYVNNGQGWSFPQTFRSNSQRVW